MSRIMAKAFDASKKIIRSVFKGSPNLFTTSDLNRQVEAIKYQLDQIEDRVGVSSDMRIIPSLTSGTLSVSFNYTYLEAKGCSFLPGIKTLEINLTRSAPLAYLCLTADKDEVTYDSDSSHEFSGAVFEDGTSFPAANQIVYSNEDIILTHAFSSVENLVAILAVIELVDGKVVVSNNFLEKGNSVLFKDKPITKDYTYEVESIDFTTNSFRLPGYFNVAVGDVIEFSIVFGHIGNDVDGYDTGLTAQIFIRSLAENSASAWGVFTRLETGGPSFTGYQVVFNPDNLELIVVTEDASRFSAVGKSFVRVYKNGDFL